MYTYRYTLYVPKCLSILEVHAYVRCTFIFGIRCDFMYNSTVDCVRSATSAFGIENLFWSLVLNEIENAVFVYKFITTEL